MDKDIKKYILKGFESKIEQILADKSKNIFLTKRDLSSLSQFMERHRILSFSVIKFIFKTSTYSHSYDPHDKIINIYGDNYTNTFFSVIMTENVSKELGVMRESKNAIYI